MSHTFIVRLSAFTAQQSITDTMLQRIVRQAQNTEQNQLKQISVSSPNILLLNQEESSIKIKNVRDLIQELTYTPYENTARYVFFWQAEKTTLPAQNALLKTIEEPPQNTFLYLLTQYPHKLLPTIQSRSRVVVFNEKQIFSNTFSNTSNPDVSDTVQKIATTFSQPQQSNYTHFIEIATSYKKKEDALSFLEDLIIFYRNESTFPNYQSILLIKKILSTKTNIEHNSNPQLALEQLFFSVKKSVTK